MELEEKMIILFLGDKKKYAALEAKIEDEYYDLFDKLEYKGYVKGALTKDDNDKLTIKGKRLFDEIEKSLKKLTELDYIILDYLSHKLEPVTDIHKDCDQLRLYGREEVFDANHKLKDYGYVDFLDEPNDFFNCTWLSITDEGRKVLREKKNEEMKESGEDSVTFKRKDKKGQIIEKNITASEIADIIRNEKKLYVMQKNEWCALLSKITGLSESSFKNYL